MELKQWLGLVGVGVALLIGSVAINQPKDIFARKGVSAPDLSGVDTGAAPSAVSAQAPEESSVTPPPTPEAVASETPTAPPAAATKDAASEKQADEEEEAEEEPAEEESAPAAAQPTVTVSGPEGRFIRGVVSYTGKKKSNPKIDMSSDPTCNALAAGKEMHKEGYVINDGKLANVVLYLDDKSLPKQKWDVKKEQVVINQEGCHYVPHAVAVQIGQDVEIRNDDPTTHNVHLVSRKNGDWNKSQPTKGEKMPMVQPFRREEIGTAAFKCDIHPWMECKAYVFDHPFFALSGKDGSFSIDCSALPNGEYELVAYHEKLRDKYAEGDKKGHIKVKLTDEGANVTINYTGKKKK